MLTSVQRPPAVEGPTTALTETWAASFYSYVAFALIEKDRERLEAHGVAVE